MSPRYKCKDCGFKWDDVEVAENESNYFLRCLRCESRNISLPKKSNKAKLVKKLIFSILFGFATGIMGASIGYVICAVMLLNNCWFFALIGFVIGLLIPLFISLVGSNSYKNQELAQL